jgi:hypothetical protein
MLSIRKAVFLMIAALTAPLAQAQDGPAIGMVLEASDTVEIERGGSSSGARLADLLYAGDRLITNTGQIAFVFCPTESRLDLASGATLELNAGGFNSVSGPQPASTAIPCVLPQVSLGAESMERIGALRGRGYPPIELYFGGQVSQNRPGFIWSEIEDAESYHLLLLTLNGDFVWEVDTPETSASYADDLPDLQDGERYRWEVTATSGNDIVGQQAVNFTVTLDPDLTEATGAGDDLIRAVALENAGFLSEAAAIYRQYRDDERIGQRLAWLYWNAGLIAAANAELEQLP